METPEGPGGRRTLPWLIVVVVVFFVVVVFVVVFVVVVVCNHSVCGKACVTAKAHIHKNQPGSGIREAGIGTGTWQLGGPAKDRLECNDVDTRHSTHTHDKPPLYSRSPPDTLTLNGKSKTVDPFFSISISIFLVSKLRLTGCESTWVK